MSARRLRRRAVVWVVAVGCGAGCNPISVIDVPDDPIPEPKAILTLDPDAFEFGAVGTDRPGIAQAWVRNDGDAELEITDLVVEGSPEFSVSFAPTLPFRLGPGLSVQYGVRYEPTVGGRSEGLIAFTSNSAEADEDDRTIATLGGDGAIPRLEFVPSSWTPGASYVGCGDWTDITVRSVGSDTLIVESLSVVGDEAWNVTPTVDLPWELAPGDEVTVRVETTIPGLGLREAQLVATGNMPTGEASMPMAIEGVYEGDYQAALITPTETPVTILIAVDQSGSMDDTRAQLQDGLDQMVTRLDGLSESWRIGVVTLDHGCFNQGVLDPQTLNLHETFAAAVETPGEALLTLTEALLELTDRALLLDAPGACNEGFLTPNVPLDVIIFSDEPDASLDPWQRYQERWSLRLGDPGLLRVHAVVDRIGACGFGGAAGYFDIASATGGQVEDVCGTAWVDALSSIAEQASTYRVRIPMYGVAVDVASIVVEVDGAVWPTGWHYDYLANAVAFDVDIPGGTYVNVSWRATTDCPASAFPP